MSDRSSYQSQSQSQSHSHPSSSSSRSRSEANSHLHVAHNPVPTQSQISPTVVAASLRSVLSHMSPEELSRYKAAFQSYDVDEDGYLNLSQAFEALRACGVKLSSAMMLDTLEDLEVAQECDLQVTPWEQEQNRRRRRRRRASLEQIEQAEQLEALKELGVTGGTKIRGGHGTGIPAYKEEVQPQTTYDTNNPESTRRFDRNIRPLDPPPSLTRTISLENAPNHSSLKSPTIDISTFLNLARAPAPPPSVGMPTRTVSKLSSMSQHPTPSSHTTTSSSSRISQLSPSPVASPDSDWINAGYQASSNAQQQQPQHRGYTNIATDVTHSSADSSSTSSSTRPSLRLRDHSLGFSTAHLLAQSLAAAGRRALHNPGDDLDDDFDFDPEQDLLAAFHTFDPSKSGVITDKDMVAIMMHLGEKWSEEEAIEMVEEVDVKREGRFNYVQLVKKLAARE